MTKCGMKGASNVAVAAVQFVIQGFVIRHFAAMAALCILWRQAASANAQQRLSAGLSRVTVPAMYAFARFLQLVALAIPPITIVAQLGEHIRAGQMLQFLVASVCLFTVGYLLQQHSGKQR